MQIEKIISNKEIKIKKYLLSAIEKIKEKIPKIAKIIDKIKASVFINCFLNC